VIDLVLIPAGWLFLWSVGVIIIYNGLMYMHERRRIREINERVDELFKNYEILRRHEIDTDDDDDDYRPGKIRDIVV
tara:strand:+ start:2490 stop:2720 length:231 start_codon:yes stop_codon:yes gene_type:complete